MIDHKNEQDSPDHRENFRSLQKLLVNLEDSPTEAKVHFELEGRQVGFTVDRKLVQNFAELMRHVAEGTPFTIMPLNSVLTTQEAADMLNVSRPFFVKLLDDNQIPHTKTGTHRRVIYSDVLQFKKQRDAESENVLQQLSDDAQGLGILI